MSYLVTPVVMFVFNRPGTVRKVVDALRQQTVRPEKLIVYADGARGEGDEKNIRKVAEIINSITWAKVTFVQRYKNLGCASNIIQGLSAVFQQAPRAVVVEDDVLPARRFYESMLLLFEKYASEERIFSVGGYPSVAGSLSNYPYDVILSPRFSCWGWGTWAERWNSILPDLQDAVLPYSDQADIPTYAGADLPSALSAVQQRPGYYWDYPVALISLQRAWLHAHTNYYLVNNIGLTSGTHGNASRAAVRFFKENNRIQDKVPSRFPPFERRPEVTAALQAYLSSIPPTGRAGNRITRTLASLFERFKQRFPAGQ